MPQTDKGDLLPPFLSLTLPQTTFRAQAEALAKKNLSYQSRNRGQNICLVISPVLLCSLLAVLQLVINNAFDSPDNRCGCKCLECEVKTNDVPGGPWWGMDLPAPPGTWHKATDDSPCPTRTPMDMCRDWDQNDCGIQYSEGGQAGFCEIANPATWPSMAMLPQKVNLTAEEEDKDREFDKGGSPETSARILVTGGGNGKGGLFDNLLYPFPAAGSKPAVVSDAVWAAQNLRKMALGTTQDGLIVYQYDPALDSAVYVMNDDCASVDAQALNLTRFSETTGQDFQCLNMTTETLPSSDTLEEKLFCSWRGAKCEQRESFVGGYDFRNSEPKGDLEVDIWQKDMNFIGGGRGGPPTNERLNRMVNMATQSYVQSSLGEEHGVYIEGIREMPKAASRLTLSFSSLLGVGFFMWLLQSMLPIVMIALVEEQEQRVRLMMKLQGLRDGVYWTVTYLYHLAIYCTFCALLLIFGGPILTAANQELHFFSINSTGILIITFFLYGNIQIAFGFVMAKLFRTRKAAASSANIWVFGTTLMCGVLFDRLIEEDKWFLPILEIIPPIGLYRSLYELGAYAFIGAYKNGVGMTFASLSDSENGLLEVWIIWLVQWPILMALNYYLDQVLDLGTGIARHPLFFLEPLGYVPTSQKKTGALIASAKKEEANQMALVLETEDVRQERQRVEGMMARKDSGARADAIVVSNLRKVFPGSGPNPDKVACRQLSLGIHSGECFGLLGPNGAGKSTTINMMTGFLEPTEGEIFIEGLDLQVSMKEIYSIMGVCPQDNLLWPTLTAEEHLRFYGRLKNLSGQALEEAVAAKLKDVNLTAAGKKQVHTYSGGMKRRLSVAISIIGDPLVVYLDEPSTGLDPASRRLLWDVVKKTKRERAVVLTTHSMEEAEVLCDRLGIFVGGEMACLGGPRQLVGAHGGYLVFTLSIEPDKIDQAKAFVLSEVDAQARLSYELAGTLRFEIPRDSEEGEGAMIVKVFGAMEKLGGLMTVRDWGLSHATLEEVFVGFARQAIAKSH